MLTAARLTDETIAAFFSPATCANTGHWPTAGPEGGLRFGSVFEGLLAIAAERQDGAPKEGVGDGPGTAMPQPEGVWTLVPADGVGAQPETGGGQQAGVDLPETGGAQLRVGRTQPIAHVAQTAKLVEQPEADAAQTEPFVAETGTGRARRGPVAAGPELPEDKATEKEPEDKATEKEKEEKGEPPGRVACTPAPAVPIQVPAAAPVMFAPAGSVFGVPAATAPVGSIAMAPRPAEVRRFPADPAPVAAWAPATDDPAGAAPSASSNAPDGLGVERRADAGPAGAVGLDGALADKPSIERAAPAGIENAAPPLPAAGAARSETLPIESRLRAQQAASANIEAPVTPFRGGGAAHLEAPAPVSRIVEAGAAPLDFARRHGLTASPSPEAADQPELPAPVANPPLGAERSGQETPVPTALRVDAAGESLAGVPLASQAAHGSSGAGPLVSGLAIGADAAPAGQLVPSTGPDPATPGGLAPLPWRNPTGWRTSAPAAAGELAFAARVTDRIELTANLEAQAESTPAGRADDPAAPRLLPRPAAQTRELPLKPAATGPVAMSPGGEAPARDERERRAPAPAAPAAPVAPPEARQTPHPAAAAPAAAPAPGPHVPPSPVPPPGGPPPPQPAPSAAVAMPAERPPETPGHGSVREIAVTVAPGPAGPDVEVRLVERAGGIHAAVRTHDAELSASLRARLDDLVFRLERHGLATETWIPAPEGVSEAQESGAAGSGTDSRSREPGGHRSLGGQPQGGGRQHGREGQEHAPPGWLDELESAGLARSARRFLHG